MKDTTTNENRRFVPIFFITNSIFTLVRRLYVPKFSSIPCHKLELHGVGHIDLSSTSEKPSGGRVKQSLVKIQHEVWYPGLTNNPPFFDVISPSFSFLHSLNQALVFLFQVPSIGMWYEASTSCHKTTSARRKEIEVRRLPKSRRSATTGQYMFFTLFLNSPCRSAGHYETI